jgi:ADP-heptose:LPS heptosyltransferase
MTGAIESLHTLYPGQYRTGVDSTCPEIFFYNKWVEDLSGVPDVRPILMEYPGINRSNQVNLHFLQAYCDYLGEQLGIPLPCQVNRPYLYFSPEEGIWMSRVAEIYGRERKHWILSAGVKQDYTAKGWVQSYWQEVVDRLAGRVLFVQIGHQDHLHKPLKGVVDQIGKTNLRELIRLCRSAEGGVGPITFIGHCMAALGKPYICISGGREPPSFIAYNTQTTLHTIGALSCCLTPCWRSRVVPLNDGDHKDTELCYQPIPLGSETVQRCMSLITPGDVVRAIERYLSGDVISC